MSFGFSVGDFLAVGQLTWTVYRASAPRTQQPPHNAPRTRRRSEISNSLLNRRGAARKPELDILLRNLEEVLWSIENIVQRYRSLGRDQKKTWDRVKFASEDLATLRQKLTFHTSAIQPFFSSLFAGSLARIEGILDDFVQDIKAGLKEPSVISTSEDDDDEVAWSEQERELIGDGITRQDVERHKDDIKEYLKKLVLENMMDIGTSSSDSLEGDAYEVQKVSTHHSNLASAVNSYRRLNSLTGAVETLQPSISNGNASNVSAVGGPSQQDKVVKSPQEDAENSGVRDHFVVWNVPWKALLKGEYRILTTSSKRISFIYDIVIGTLQHLNVSYTRVLGGFCCRSGSIDQPKIASNRILTFYITIIRLPLLGLHGVQFEEINYGLQSKFKDVVDQLRTSRFVDHTYSFFSSFPSKESVNYLNKPHAAASSHSRPPLLPPLPPPSSNKPTKRLSHFQGRLEDTDNYIKGSLPKEIVNNSLFFISEMLCWKAACAAKARSLTGLIRCIRGYTEIRRPHIIARGGSVTFTLRCPRHVYTLSPKTTLKMQPTQLKLCETCRSAASTSENLKILKTKGITICRGPRQSLSNSSCELRKAAWYYIDAYNSRRISEGAHGNDLLMGEDPVVYVRGYLGGDKRGKELYDIDELKLLYAIKKSGREAPLVYWDVWAEADNPAARCISTRPLESRVNDESAWQQISSWLDTCIKEHGKCPSPLKRPLPTRLLDVGAEDGSQDPRIHVSNGEWGQYAVLSYCWGGPQPLTLTLETFPDKVQGISMDSLPRSLQDAVSITRKLGLRYIWIDALCIIQDSPEDKVKELAEMDQIYQNGLLTICGASASNVNEGFLQSRKAPNLNFPPFTLPFLSDDPNYEAGNIILQEEKYYDPYSEPINQRGWTLQERLLSPRVLIYGSHQLMWQCQTSQLSHGGVGRKFYDSGSERLDVAFFSDPENTNSSKISPPSFMDLTYTWLDVVTDYSHRQLSFSNDKLNAIAGIASRFRDLKGENDMYLAGMWKSSLVMELLWMVDPSSKTLQRGRARPKEYRAPSWSWAAIDGPVAFGGSWADWPEKVPKFAKILRCETTLESNELPTGCVTDGLLEIKGQMKQAKCVAGSDNLFDICEKEEPLGKAYLDVDESVDMAVWCLRVQDSFGILLRDSGEADFQRVGYFEIREGKDWKTTTWSSEMLSEASFGPEAAGRFDFTLAFEDAILSILPSALFFILAPQRLFWLMKQPRKVAKSSRSILKLGLIGVYTVLQLAVLLYWTLGPEHILQLQTVAAVLVFVNGLLLLFMSHAEHTRSVRPSTLITVYLFLSLLFDCVIARTLWLLGGAGVIGRLFTSTIPIKFLVLAIEAWEKRSILLSQYQHLSPEVTSGILSRSVFWWLNPLLKTGFGRFLTDQDLYPIHDSMVATKLLPQAQKSWGSANQSKKNALAFSTLWATKYVFLSGVLPRLCLAAFKYTLPFLINTTTLFAEDLSQPDATGWGLTGAWLLSVYSPIDDHQISNGFYYQMTYRRGDAHVHRYGEYLSDAATLHELWASPIECGVAIYLLYRQLGMAALAPVIVVIVATTAIMRLAKYIGNAQKIWVRGIQTRVDVTASVLGSMKEVKMLGLLDIVTKMVQDLRVRELKLSKRYRRLFCLQLFIGSNIRTIAPLATFATFVITSQSTGQPLDTASAYTSLSLIYLLSDPLVIVIRTIPYVSAALACFGRIQNFLLSESCKDHRLPLNKSNPNEDAPPDRSPRLATNSTPVELRDLEREPILPPGAPLVVISDASFGWTRGEPSILSNITITIRKSYFTFIIGNVGSGKSTLMKAMLGEIQPFKGSIYVGIRNIAFVGQEPWIQNLTIRQNILGISSYDRDWYSKVVHACGLEQDISELPNSDVTRAGSAGVSLSGGQKQRLALARAVYSREKVVFLDDVFAGQDAATEEHIFQNLFAKRGLFREMGTTVVCITNTIHRLVNADYVIALDENGHILHQGSFKQLQSDTNYLQGLVVEQNGSVNAQDKAEPSINNHATAPQLRAPDREAESPSRVLGELATYRYYFGSVPLWYTLLFAALVILYAGGYKMTELLLSFWTGHANAGQTTNDFYLGLYGMLSGLAVLGITGAAYFFLITMVPLSSEVLHARLLQSVIDAPLAFFSRTDVGVTTNRFSQDMSVIDTELPFALADFAVNFAVLLMGTILMCVFSGYFAATVPPVIFFCWLLQKFYLKTSRQIRLLDLEAKSPLFTQFLDLLQGLPSVRAFAWEARFKEKYLELLDASQRPYYLLFCIQR
ncbi:hypothetical protein G7Y89_g13080 [Cudoniella acicularis]|uniref:Uncharacterized protein n=1 Tax=Cudoniella acicularis TaxID=354080 RepID=A0A8H4RAA8_9HELO|nr:hypothetical protein G7Y89_g13080 [Cudoniella acicularis]